jgi:ATP-dependent Clp protease ATP-binding subunit ClpA
MNEWKRSMETHNLADLLSQKIVGQQEAVDKIVPCIEMYQAGLSPAGRPAGVFLLLGPTGTGKTRTVEALAEVLHGHGNPKVIRIDCGEYQCDHDVAKLIGAPPGYIGHRETNPVFTAQCLNEATSEKCDLSLVLFDEIEKAAPSIAKLLLGLLDSGMVRLGDNTQVSFEKTLIFFTSNLGAAEMRKEGLPQLGFRSKEPEEWSRVAKRIEHVALAAVRRTYSPEFVNRLDAVITYQPLDEKASKNILDQQLIGLQDHVNARLGRNCFTIDVPQQTRQFLLDRGVSAEYGARELKRTIYRYLTQPLSRSVIKGEIEPASCVVVNVADDNQSLRFSSLTAGKTRSVHRSQLY